MRTAIDGISDHYSGYILRLEDGKHEFSTVNEMCEFIDSLGHELYADERLDYQIHEWPDGTWLSIRGWDKEDECE